MVQFHTTLQQHQSKDGTCSIIIQFHTLEPEKRKKKNTQFFSYCSIKVANNNKSIQFAQETNSITT